MTRTRGEIESGLKALLAGQEEIDYDVASITEETKIDEVGFDSLSILDFMYEIESSFEVQLDVKELVEIQKVSDLIDLLQTKLAG